MSDSPNTARDPLARLIHDAGHRVAPPAQAYERALLATTQVWQKKVRGRRLRLVSALAACLGAISVGAAVVLNSFDAPAPMQEPVVRVAHVIGDARVRTTSSHEWRSMNEELTALPSDTVLRTGPASAVALQAGDASIRIAGGAEIILESRSRLRLKRGKVYVDTGSAGVQGRMVVVTDAGSVADIGTQFEVLYENGHYRVRVREGYVLLERGEQRRRGSTGDDISIDRNGRVSIASIAANDPEWRWVQSLASAPEIDDRPLAVLVAWVARETGMTVRYATPAVERKATTTILHGSIRNLEPLEALAVMLATTDLRHEVRPDGTIMIR